MNQNKKPYFIITIDTEGDDLWSHPQYITTENAKFLPRFQKLCEFYGFKTTYLVNYEMACSNIFKDFGLEVLSKNTGEIGMHLHPWNNPPIKPLTKDDYFYQPYLIEYTKDIISEKIKIITELLEDSFNIKVISHRSGRWSFNDNYAQSLSDYGYKVDCSVTPLRSWENTTGNPNGNGGSDYVSHPNQPYWITSIDNNKKNILLEVPVTIISGNKRINYLIDNSMIPRKWMIRLLQKKIKPIWLRPNGKNINSMKEIIDYKSKDGSDYVMLILHSSELMPGGSPTFKNKKEIENLYLQLNTIFTYAQDIFQTATLSDYYAYYLNK